MLAHESSSFTNLRYRRVRKRVKEVLFRQDQGSLDTLWIDVLKRFEWLLEFAARRSGEAPSRGGQVWLRWSLGRMIPLRCDILGERAKCLRRSQLRARILHDEQAPRASV